jgi:hypothetical protein
MAKTEAKESQNGRNIGAIVEVLSCVTHELKNSEQGMHVCKVIECHP